MYEFYPVSQAWTVPPAAWCTGEGGEVIGGGDQGQTRAASSSRLNVFRRPLRIHQRQSDAWVAAAGGTGPHPTRKRRPAKKVICQRARGTGLKHRLARRHVGRLRGVGTGWRIIDLVRVVGKGERTPLYGGEI